MGCHYSKERSCYATDCCCCTKEERSCYWITFGTLVWGLLSMTMDYAKIDAGPFPCGRNCLDYETEVKLNWTSITITAVQCFVSILLVIGAKWEIPFLLLVWLIWTPVTEVMFVMWFVATVRYTPSVRAALSLALFIVFIHCFLVVKTERNELISPYVPKPRPMTRAPPNTPARKHKRRKQRQNKRCQSTVRTLLGVAIHLQLFVESQFSEDDEKKKKADLITSERMIIREKDDKRSITRSIDLEEIEICNETPSTSMREHHNNPTFINMSIENENMTTAIIHTKRSDDGNAKDTSREEAVVEERARGICSVVPKKKENKRQVVKVISYRRDDELELVGLKNDDEEEDDDGEEEGKEKEEKEEGAKRKSDPVLNTKETENQVLRRISYKKATRSNYDFEMDDNIFLL